MYNLIRKELIFNRTVLASFAAVILIFSIWMGLEKSPTGTPFTVACAFMSVTLQAREDRFKGAPLNLSLPVSRPRVLLARYAASWIITVSIIICMMAGMIVVPGGMSSLRAFLMVDHLLLWFFLISLFLSLLLPFTTRFGYMGVIILLVALQFLGAALIVISRITTNEPNLIRGAVQTVVSVVDFLKTGLGATGFRVFVVVFCLALNALSFFLSRFLFLRKDF